MITPAPPPDVSVGPPTAADRQYTFDRRALGPTIAVAAIALGLYFGAQALDANVAGSAPDSAQVVGLGSLRLTLPPGWRAGTSADGLLRLTKGGVAIDISSASPDLNLSAAYRSYLADSVAPRAVGFTAGQPADVLMGGAAGLRGSYSGAFAGIGQVDGELSALEVDGQTVLVDAHGPPSAFSGLQGEVWQLIDGAAVAP